VSQFLTTQASYSVSPPEDVRVRGVQNRDGAVFCHTATQWIIAKKEVPNNDRHPAPVITVAVFDRNLTTGRRTRRPQCTTGIHQHFLDFCLTGSQRLIGGEFGGSVKAGDRPSGGPSQYGFNGKGGEFAINRLEDQEFLMCRCICWK
jgi:hypothetical protein